MEGGIRRPFLYQENQAKLSKGGSITKGGRIIDFLLAYPRVIANERTG